MHRIRPLSISLPVVVFFVACCWFDMAGINYSGGNPLFALRTAGWFVLGFPFLLVLSYLLAWFTTSMYHRFGIIALVIILMALNSCLIFSIQKSLPRARLSGVIGSKLANNAQIHQLISNDSFGDGTLTLGEIAGTSELLKQIAAHRSLRQLEIIPVSHFRPLIADVGDYRTHLAYGDSRSVFFLSPETSTIYFSHRGG